MLHGGDDEGKMQSRGGIKERELIVYKRKEAWINGHVDGCQGDGNIGIHREDWA